MKIDTRITTLFVESDSGQTGNALKKIWDAPFDFNIIAYFKENGDYDEEWDDYYSFVCKVENINDKDAVIKFRGQNKRCSNPCKMRVLRGNSFPMAVFECRVETPGEYVVTVNEKQTRFKVI